jgi:hypothetical protein
LDLYTYGINSLYTDGSFVTARVLAPELAAAKVESGACIAQTAQTMLNTFMQSSYNYGGCTSRSGVYLSSFFNKPGRWTLTSRTGRVRITFRARTYIYSSTGCYTESKHEINPVINSQVVPVAAVYTQYAHYSTEYDRAMMLVDFIYDVVPGSFTLDFLFYFRGQSAQLNGDSEGGFTYLRVEDIPKEQRTPATPALPTGCNGIPRRYLIQSHVTTDHNLRSTSGAVTYLSLRDMTANTNRFDLSFNILQDATRVRLTIKVDSYLRSTSYSSGIGMLRLIPYIDDKSQGICTERSMQLYAYTYDYEEGPATCDMEVVLAKGTHKLQLQAYGRGDAVTVRGGSTRSLIMLEELVHAA